MSESLAELLDYLESRYAMLEDSKPIGRDWEFARGQLDTAVIVLVLHLREHPEILAAYRKQRGR